MSFDCRRVKFDKCEYGVYACDTKGRLTNCQVTNCRISGIVSYEYSTIEIEGEETRIHNNCTDGESGDYGLNACKSSSIIHLLSPLTKDDVSTNNNGGQNYGGKGTIETVNLLMKEKAAKATQEKTAESAKAVNDVRVKAEIATKLGVAVDKIVSYLYVSSSFFSCDFFAWCSVSIFYTLIWS
jgi:hypothetical protein